MTALLGTAGIGCSTESLSDDEAQAAPTLETSVSALTSTVTASDDTFIRDTQPDTAFGGYANIEADTYPENEYGLVRFNVDLPAGATITSVKLRMYVVDVSTTGLDVHHVDSSWTESTTWNTRPTRGTRIGAMSSMATLNTYAEADVTSAVTGNGLHDFYLIPLGTEGVAFNSSESTSGRPELQITYTTSNRTLVPNTSLSTSELGYDANAVGDYKQGHWNNGDYTTFIAPSDLASGSYTVKVRARGGVFEGGPRFSLKIDGTTVATNVLVDSSSYITVTAGLFSVSAGQQLVVTFTNDYSVSGVGDRNLHVDEMYLEKAVLTDSGPIVVNLANTIIENKRIISNYGTALEINAPNVIVRNCEILHRNDCVNTDCPDYEGHGIELNHADGTIIQDVRIKHTGAPAKWWTKKKNGSSTTERNNIDVYSSQNVTITRVRLEKGSSGIYMYQSPYADLSYIEGYDFRGPMPRGQLVQFNQLNNSTLTNFSVISYDYSWPEDNVSAYNSPEVQIKKGYIDYNDSRSGVGVMIEIDNTDWYVKTNCLNETAGCALVEDVDARRMGNGAFSAYPAKKVTFNRTRARDNMYCSTDFFHHADVTSPVDQFLDMPSSGALTWAARAHSGETCSSAYNRVLASTSWNLTRTPSTCPGANPDGYGSDDIWSRSCFSTIEITEADFTMRAPIVNTFSFALTP